MREEEQDDYILDIDSLRAEQPTRQGSPRTGGARPYISVHFSCCKLYQRVYRNREGTAYVGWCPKCARKLVARIGPEGTDQRFFEAR